MDTLGYVDAQIFLFINHLPHGYVPDQLALFLSVVGKWGAVWLIIALILFFREEKRDHWFFVPSIFVATGTAVSEFLLKALFARSRPTVDMGAIIIGSADNFSFPSSHATLAFAFAYVLARKEPRWKNALYALAVLISISRIYLGVHYPSDVIGGAALGSIIGCGAVALEKYFSGPKKQHR